MTGSGIEITIRFLQYVFTTLVLAMFHYDSSGNFPVDVRFQWQNEFLPTQNRLALLRRDVLGALRVLDKYREGGDILAREAPELAAEATRLEEEADLPYFRENLPRVFESSD